MGVVYLARDLTLDRLVAIKLLPPALAEHPGIRTRFLREARTAARLSHPNIVPIHAVEEAGRLVFFVMGYVPGQTLGGRIRTGGPLPAAEAGRILRDVAWALGYAHQQGVIHRDIKADNILLESPGRRTLVTDFGIARMVGELDDEPLAGTVAYMSPEQARGEPVDARGDLWSLGIVGYFALSGTLPHPVDTIESLRARFEDGEAPSAAAAAPHAPRALVRALDRCLAMEPARRFGTAEELAAALDQLATGPAELPVPLRLWVTGEDRARGVVLMWSVVTAFPAAALLISTFGYGANALGPALAMLISGMIPWLLFGGARFARTRKALAAGYTRGDLLLALKAHSERRREELAFEIGTAPSRFGRWLRRITWTSLGVAVVMVAMPFIGNPLYSIAWSAAALVATGGALLGMFIPGRSLPSKPKRSLREKLWAGPLGRLLVRVAGWRLGRRATPELTLHRPTEVALGEAADALFRALPGPLRRDLADLPEQLERLASQAQLLRARLGELDLLIGSAQVRRSPASGDQAAAALTASRDVVAGQLKDTVTLLESLRVGLIRLHAGAATPETITTQLGTARSLEGRMGDLARANEQLDRWLAGPGPITPPSGAGASG